MAEDTFDQTKHFLRDNPDFIKNTAFLISHDPDTGRKASHSIFVVDEHAWIIDQLLMNSYFKHAYLAENFETGERAVLAITKSPVGTDSSELRVTKKLTKLNLSGIAEILGIYNLNNGRKAIMYRYYNGGDLYTKIEEKSLTEKDRKIIADYLISSVAEMHQHGIFHRDIKPSNVLLQVDLEGAVTHAVLSDFGEGTALDAPQSIRNIEHYHSAPEGNALMEKHKKQLKEWYKLEEKRKEYEEVGETPSEEFKARSAKINEAVSPLVQELKEATTNPLYDSWSLGLTLWCLFTNQRSSSFLWRKAVDKVDYDKIAQLKKQFFESESFGEIPEPYRNVTKGLLEADCNKRITAEKALALLE